MQPFRVTQTPLIGATLGPPVTTRLEPQSVSGDPQVGLAAQLWDPLWLLGRQWQVGELAGEDTGTPLTLRVRASFDPLVAWRPGPAPDSPEDGWLPLPADRLLEALVDAEPPPGDHPPPREAAHAGWALLDTLFELGEDRAVVQLRRRFPAPDPVPVTPPGTPPGAPAGTAVVPDVWSPVAALLGGRGIDAAGTARAFEAAEPDRPAWWRAALRAGGRRRREAEQALAGWLAWYRAEVEPGVSPATSWLGQRLEHEFGLATAGAVLRAPGYAGGDIGWSDVDLVPDASPPAVGVPGPRTLERTVIATPLSFPGMPATRFWEMEDGRVDLGSVWADPHELARLLVIECALVYGGDWLVVPLDVPSGGVARVESVTYTDTFGTTWVVDSTPSFDPRRWRMYAVTAAPPATGDDDLAPRNRQLDGLFVPPASAGRVEGPPVEDVLFLRDEAANMVWAVERLVAGPGGDPAVPRARPAPDPHRPPPQEGEPVLGYTVMTQVPETWTPYLPRLGSLTDSALSGVALVRGRVRRSDEGGNERDVTPSGVLLQSDEHLLVDSAEVPRQGVRVQRVPMLARRGDGGWESWTGRRVLVGRGEGESGLRFDHVTQPRPG